MRTLITFILFVGVTSFSSAQVTNEEYFSDTIQGYLDKVHDYIEVEDGIIIAGTVSNSAGIKPVVLRLNLLGEVVWSSINSSSVIYSANVNYFKIELLDDGFIYGVSSEYIWPSVDKTIWKIGVETGIVEWQTPFYSDYANNVFDLVDYDSSSFLITYFESQGVPRLGTISKSTGDTTSTYLANFQTFGSRPCVSVDKNKNIYLGYGSKLYKFNSNNTQQVIWNKQYFDGNLDLQDIRHIYLDAYDNIYLFGRTQNSSSGNPVIMRVDPMMGDDLWRVASFTNVVMADFVDRFDQLYITFQHSQVGGINAYNSTLKVDKNVGTSTWYSTENVTPLGSTSSTSGNSETALSLDIDCNGDVYQTGYYGDANYGPEQWGIMKLNGANGVKTFDLTITEDSASYDHLSVGIGACVFQNSPVFVGNLEKLNNDVKAQYVTVDPVSGLPVIRKEIGAEYQHFSRTKEILNNNDSIFVLKQQGDDVVVEMYDQSGSLVWDQSFISGNVLSAGNISISGQQLYVSLLQRTYDSIPPYSYPTAESLKLYQLNSTTGGIINSDSLIFLADSVRLLELESDIDASYVFYAKNGQVNSVKWNISLLSNELQIGPFGSNIDPSINFNNVINYSNDSLLIATDLGIQVIQKTTFALSPLLNFPTQRNSYDFQLFNGSFIVSGSSLSGDQILSSFDETSTVLNWDQSYSTGEIYGVKLISDTLFTYGKDVNSMTVNKVSMNNGSLTSTYNHANSPQTSSVCYDLQFYPNQNEMVLAGAEIELDSSSNVLFEMINTQGNNLWTYSQTDEVGAKSLGSVLEVQSNTVIWAGGSLNRITQGKEGFIYQFHCSQQPIDCSNTIVNTVDTTVCSSFNLPSGNNSYTVSGTYVDTIPSNGCCDSVITFNVTILQPSSGTDMINACESYTWIDGNTYTSSNTSATWTLTDTNGCDSVVTLNLTINYASTGIDNQSACESYTWIDGNTYTSNNNTSTWLLTSSEGCDSLVTLNLTIGSVNLSVIDSSPTLTAAATNVIYQWVDCDNNYSPIAGETNQSFTATSNGNYAVIIVDGSCIDTSQCYPVTNVGNSIVEFDNSILIYPNPTSQELNVDLGKVYSNIEVEIITLLGQVVKSQSYESTKKLTLNLDGAKGVYLMRIRSEGRQSTYRVIKR